MARKLIGYEPMVDFDEGLARTIKYYQRDAQGMKELIALPSRIHLLMSWWYPV